MAEYWKSTPKYWCKHCSIYVKDTPFERKQHENTGKHQGNLKRFLRGIQNDHERNERDKEKVKNEVERLNRVVGGSAAASTPASSNANQPPLRTRPAATLTAADQKRQWTQLAEMGIAVPENFRGKMSMPGDWQTIVPEVSDEGDPGESLSKGVRKRKLDEHDLDEGTDEPTIHRGWGQSMRSYPDLTQDDSLDSLLKIPKSKKEPTIKAEGKEGTAIDAHQYAHTSTGPDTIDQDKEQPALTRFDRNTSEQGAVSEVEIKVEAGGDEPVESKMGQEGSIVPVFKKRKARAK